MLVLDRINFNIKKGELVAIVGPTGCGKTTFLNCMSKLTDTTDGDIFIDGVPADPVKHNLAFVFQEPTALPWRTVAQNVVYGMEVKGVPEKERAERLEYILNLVGLKDTADLYPNQVSASMMQRIAVARAFAVNPDLLLMDEPYGQLDVKLRFYLEDELVKLWQTLNSTVLFITHNIEEAVYVAERILVLTPKPTKVRAEVIVDLPRPRNFLDPRFVEIRRQVTELIRWW
nr:ABC transporter ATP-binding protein [Propionivibrio soli]